MSIVTNYGRKGATYMQDRIPPADSDTGDVWIKTDDRNVYARDSGGYVQITEYFRDFPGEGSRGVFIGGFDTNLVVALNIIDYIAFVTLSNAYDFGDTSIITYRNAATSNGIQDRGVYNISPYSDTEYITISTCENGLVFGTCGGDYMLKAATSNDSYQRGVFGGGYLAAGVYHDEIEYITINVVGSNGITFGDLSLARSNLGACSNAIRNTGVFGGGQTNGPVYRDEMDYITINTPSNAVYFDDLIVARSGLSGTSNGYNDRGIFAGGTDSTGIIEYINISSHSFSNDFGVLTLPRRGIGCSSNKNRQRAVFGGGYTGAVDTNIIDYITINNPNDAADFGDLTVTREFLTGTSNA